MPEINEIEAAARDAKRVRAAAAARMDEHGKPWPIVPIAIGVGVGVGVGSAALAAALLYAKAGKHDG